MSTKLAPLPHPSDPRFLDAVYERLAVHTGQRGLPIDRMVTFRDLVEAGIATPKVGGGGAGVGAGGIVQPAAGLPNMTVPPPVSDLQVGGAFTRAILSWSPPAYGNHSLVEVARASVPDIGMAVTIGSSSANTYIDVVGGGFTGYWWVRNVSSAGVRGPWSPPVTATTPASHDEILKNITSAEWQPETAYSIFNPVAPTSEVKIGGVVIRLVAVSAGATGAIEPDWATEVASIGDTVLDGSVTWLAVEAGKIPFLIDPVSGLVVIDGAAIREASIESLQVKDGFFDTMTAAKGVLSEANISIANIFNALIDNYIQSSNYSAGSTGWRISANGDAEFNNLLLRGIFQNNAGDRYIDMRPGATEGDFVLGDVEGQNFVSFKFEPEYGGRILRIRGDVALRNYSPGSIVIHDNVSTRRETFPMGLFVPGGGGAEETVLYVSGTQATGAPSAGDIQDLIEAETLDLMQEWAADYPLGRVMTRIKQTVVTRSGTVRVSVSGAKTWVANCYLNTISGWGVTPAKCCTTWIALVLEKQSGAKTFLKWLNDPLPPDFDLTASHSANGFINSQGFDNWEAGNHMRRRVDPFSFVEDVAVLPGESITVMTCRVWLEYINNSVNAYQAPYWEKLTPYSFHNSQALGQSGTWADAYNITLSVDYFPEETSIL